MPDTKNAAAISAHCKYACKVVKLEGHIRNDTGIHIPHMTTHNILAENEHALRTLKKLRQ